VCNSGVRPGLDRETEGRRGVVDRRMVRHGGDGCASAAPRLASRVAFRASIDVSALETGEDWACHKPDGADPAQHAPRRQQLGIGRFRGSIGLISRSYRGVKGLDPKPCSSAALDAARLVELTKSICGMARRGPARLASWDWSPVPFTNTFISLDLSPRDGAVRRRVSAESVDRPASAITFV